VPQEFQESAKYIGFSR